MAEAEIRYDRCDELPVAWIAPAVPPAPGARPTLALWLTHLGGSKEQTFPVLKRLADAGCVAVSFDPWRHGERGSEEPRELMTRVFGGFRREMWPILGQTTLDCLRVLDWALSVIAPDAAVVAGGVSMGGDISVALAGLDPRVARVAAVVATPDWTRPGMRDIADPDTVLDQGPADTYAQWFYDRIDPLTHLDGYRHGPAVTFECGAADTHVPADGAIRFRDALLERHPAAGQRVRVNLHDGASHLDSGNDSALVNAAVDWLLA